MTKKRIQKKIVDKQSSPATGWKKKSWPESIASQIFIIIIIIMMIMMRNRDEPGKEK